MGLTAIRLTPRRFTAALAVLAALSAVVAYWADHRRMELGCCCEPGTWRK
jgi:hypothetical protein